MTMAFNAAASIDGSKEWRHVLAPALNVAEMGEEGVRHAGHAIGQHVPWHAALR